MRLFRAKDLSLILLLSLGYSIALGQIPQINIHWEAPKKILNTDGNEINVLSFEQAVYLSENKYLPAYLLKISGEVSDFKISNAITETLSVDEQAIVPSINNTAPVIHIKYAYGKPVSFIYIL